MYITYRILLLIVVCAVFIDCQGGGGRSSGGGSKYFCFFFEYKCSYLITIDKCFFKIFIHVIIIDFDLFFILGRSGSRSSSSGGGRRGDLFDIIWGKFT